MNGAAGLCFLIYTGMLAREDIKTGNISLLLTAAGAFCGLLLTACRIMSGADSAGTVLLPRLAALLWGLGLLMLSRLTRGAMGKGDGICFCSFACWWDAAELFGLLLVSLLLSAAGGTALLLLKRKKIRESLPFLPFVFAASVILYALSFFREV